eukprot:891834-Rhodomonas_salina.1
MATNNPLLPVPVEMLLGAAGVALTSWFFLRQLRTRPHPLRTILEFEWLAFPEGYCHQHPSAPLRPNMRTLILTLASTCGRCQWRESTPEPSCLRSALHANALAMQLNLASADDAPQMT